MEDKEKNTNQSNPTKGLSIHCVCYFHLRFFLRDRSVTLRLASNPPPLSLLCTVTSEPKSGGKKKITREKRDMYQTDERNQLSLIITTMDIKTE
jgi:hypothetical protein